MSERKQRLQTPPAGYEFSRDQAAAYLGISPATMSWWAYRGTGVPYVMIGRNTWYSKAALDRYIRSRVVLPVNEPTTQG